MTKASTTRICLWSGPRNISTALMYSFAQREDTSVYDEPLYAFYLNQTEAKAYHPGAEDILNSQPRDGQEVIDWMLGEHDTDVVFFKHMTHHLLDLDRSFMSQVKNVILTRDPVDMLPSFAKVIENPKMKDVGYEDHMQLLSYLENQGIKPIVIDSKLLLANPSGVLEKLCDQLGIDFDPHMLSWQAGARAEDGVWAPYWYASVHKSTGFIPYKPKEEPFPDQLTPLLESCLPLYQRLMTYSIS